MRAPLTTLRRMLLDDPSTEPARADAREPRRVAPVLRTIDEGDPLRARLEEGRPVHVPDLDIDSAVVRELRAKDVELIVPLVVRGELVGMINLGPRMSQQEHSVEDRRLLTRIANIAAPALVVARQARTEQEAARERERRAQEMRLARLIQTSFLPTELPPTPGWELAAHYEPAREVGGDFYDLVPLDDRHLAVIIGDVTDKGIPAALVMANTRSVLRGALKHERDPGAILAAANEDLCPDMPSAMFVTCLVAIVDLATGAVRFANAGHCLPLVRHDGEVRELRATGMPLGLMPGMEYEVVEARIPEGAAVLLYSDGVTETHAPDGDMFGQPALEGFLAGHDGDPGELIPRLLTRLADHTGGAGDPDDDITVVALHREVEQPSGR